MAKRAYTIIELIIVLGLIGALSAIGILGLSAFRQATQTQGAANEFLSNIQNYENMARNSIPSQVRTGTGLLGDRVDGYAIFFTTTNYSLHYCIDQRSSTGRFNCQGIESANEKINEYRSVTIYPRPADFPRCRGILFERRSGLIYSMSDLIAAPLKGVNCNIEITHVSNMTKKVVIFNLIANSYAFEK
jgi:prepilin-type N-terminal cleavage/methylation domain-containing protein